MLAIEARNRVIFKKSFQKKYLRATNRFQNSKEDSKNGFNSLRIKVQPVLLVLNSLCFLQLDLQLRLSFSLFVLRSGNFVSVDFISILVSVIFSLPTFDLLDFQMQQAFHHALISFLPLRPKKI
jgi:hypothetical protein